MSNTNGRAKIEIRLEFRQLVLLSIGTMAFSGSLFALGYFLGTKDGLQSVRSGTMAVKPQAKPTVSEPRERAKPTRAALGEVEFLFGEQSKAPKAVNATPTDVVAKEPVVDRTAIIKARTARRGIPRLSPSSVKDKATKPKEDELVALPTLPDVPKRIRAGSAVSHEKTQTGGMIPRLSVSGKNRLRAGDKKTKATPKRVEPLPTPMVAKTVSKPSIAVTNAVAPKGSVATVKKDDTKKTSVSLGHLKPTPAHDLSTYGARLFTVQVKAVTDRSAAESVSNALRAKGFEPNVILADIPDKGQWYRIRVGKFRTRAAADRFRKVLSARGASNERVIVTRY